MLFEAKHKSLAGFFKVEYSRDEPLRLRYDMAKQFDMNKAGNIVYNLDGKTFPYTWDLALKKKRAGTAWILDREDSEPRFVTAFREDKGVD